MRRRMFRLACDIGFCFVVAGSSPASAQTAKLGDSSGGVALWIGPGTEGYSTGLEIKAAR
jgi:hypothetical protein